MLAYFEDLDKLSSFWLVSITNLFGSSQFAKKKLRPLIFRLVGFSIGNSTSIAKGLRIFLPRRRLKIGKHVNIKSNCFFDNCDMITIGDFSHIGAHANFISEIREQWHYFPDLRVISNNSIEIAENVWIGSYVTLVAGIKIGYGAIIENGSIVTKDVLPNAVIAGAPAQLIRFVDDSNQNHQVAQIHSLSSKKVCPKTDHSDEAIT